MATAIVRTAAPRTELVAQDQISKASVDLLDREVPDYGEATPFTPLKPFVLEGVITFIDLKEYGIVVPNRPAEKQGVEIVVKVRSSEEAPFKSAKGIDMPVGEMRAGLEVKQTYFTVHPQMQFSLDEQARHRNQLLSAIAAAAGSPDAKPSVMLTKLRGQQLEIPVRLTRRWVRKTKGSANNPLGSDIFADTWEVLES
jgi:hypothetical protein